MKKLLSFLVLVWTIVLWQPKPLPAA